MSAIIKEKSLKDFVVGLKDQLNSKVNGFFSVSFKPGEESHFVMLKRVASALFPKKPYAAQTVAISALVKGFLKKRVLGLVAEMGCGKTLQATYVTKFWAEKKGYPTRNLILCPPTLISTWKEEIQEVLGDKAKVVDANGLDAIALLSKLRSEPFIPEKMEYWIIGLNRMKTNAAWESKLLVNRAGRLICPHCFAVQAKSSLADEDGKEAEGDFSYSVHDEDEWELKHRRTICWQCKSPMWGNKYPHETTYAPVLFIKKYLKRHFHFLVADEVHKMKGGETLQGAVLGQLAETLPKTLILTGTLSGGKASDVFYLLQRAYALNYRREERAAKLPSYSELSRFVDKYGSIERVYKKTRFVDASTGRHSKEASTIRELPGISPELLAHIFLEHTVFLRISDISDALPPYKEVLEFVDMDDEAQAIYDEFEVDIRGIIQEQMFSKDRDMRIVGQMMSSLMAWPDVPERAIKITDKKGDVVASLPALDAELLTPKDERLIECVQEANSQGRKCLIFVEYTGMGALSHVEKRLTDAGLRVLVMKPSVPTHKRLEWIRNKMATGLYDNLICHPKLVETGLNLREFPEIIFFQTGFSTFVLRQASRRSWRPGQKQDVIVRFFITRGTIQEKAMALIAQKLQNALILEGELSDKGLVSLSGSNSVSDLAREMLSATDGENSLESIFASYRAAEESALKASTAEFEIPQGIEEVAEEDISVESAEPTKTVEPVAVEPVVVSVSQEQSVQDREIRKAQSLAQMLRGLRTVGSVDPSPYDRFLLSGKIKRTDVVISTTADGKIAIGSKIYPSEGNLVFEKEFGVLLDSYILVPQPSLFGNGYTIYAA